ncbi:MAG TPA: PSD1 and planctomycete cytochrome C domain-containing protein [Pirellulales bacterium]|nr:PSD1 and planctomycete cytochrome C domain-containing protein [Pirellulales bacterium]
MRHSGQTNLSFHACFACPTLRVAGLLVFCLVPALPVPADDAFFRERVAPIFEAHCVRCHQGEDAKGGLSIARHEDLLKGGESGPVVVPGKPAESLLVEYISGKSPEMPKGAPPLAAEQVAAIRRWVEQGAIWPDGLALKERVGLKGDWWSLKPLQDSHVPDLESTWVRTPIDAFVLKKLHDQGLEPSAEADRRTLLRRLKFDLHGLPPAPEELDEFANDSSLDAYPRLVDRLLASPHYGERWGRHWLDVVHYGESHGYDKDKPRPNSWPYRDWVIESLNADKPYSRFVAEQIAGDVLFVDDPQAIVATGFLVAGPWDFVGHVELREGTVDKDIARSNDRDDMVATTASTFLSLTVHCARCHNHKFDPITQEDYYRLQAVFAGIDRAERPYDADPRVATRRRELLAEKKSVESRQQALASEVRQQRSPEIEALDTQMAATEQELSALPIEPGEASPTLGYHSQIMPTPESTKWVQVDLGRSLPLDDVVLVPAHVVYGGHPGPGFGFPARFRVELSDDPTFATSQLLADETGADYPHPGDTPYRIHAEGKGGRYLRITATRLWKRTGDWIFALAELLAFADGRNAAAGCDVSALDSIEAPPGWAKRNLVDGFSSRERITDPSGTMLSPRQELSFKLAALADERRHQALVSLEPAVRHEMAAVAHRLAELQAKLSALPAQQMVFAACHDFAPQGSFTPAREPRSVHLLARGDVRNPKQLMSPGAVACVSGPSAEFVIAHAGDEGRRRAALANWLTDPGNALVRRSIVNRVWQYHFGQGIVDTPNDFGRMGSPPTHAELLDWLARWFMEHGESLKELHRLIVTSAVYRQASAEKPDYAKIDAGNRLLWRMNRMRLDAESVHDAMLVATGRLDGQMGGPSVQQFYFKDDHSPVYDYERYDVDAPGSCRRSVYRFLVRSVPDPFMECLDCADPSILTPKRNTTLTALQALSLLNNPLSVHQAQHLAERVSGAVNDLSGQIDAAYRFALGRIPTAGERERLVSYAQRFGLANACRVIFNSNEFVFVD